MINKEECICKEGTEKKIMFTFDDNVFCCMNCNLPIKKELIKEYIVNWHAEYYAIYHLWLLSGDYEEWAKLELENINSKLNQKGLKIAKEEKCFYWLHSENTEKIKPSNNCPSCGSKMEEYEGKVLIQKICKKCSIVTI